MSIKTAIDKLTGKSSKNIEDAISNVELGGSGGVFLFNIYYDAETGKMTFTKTWRELFEACRENKFVVGQYNTELQVETYYVCSMTNSVGSNPKIIIRSLLGQNNVQIQVDSEDDYPAWED